MCPPARNGLRLYCCLQHRPQVRMHAHHMWRGARHPCPEHPWYNGAIYRATRRPVRPVGDGEHPRGVIHATRPPGSITPRYSCDPALRIAHTSRYSHDPALRIAHTSRYSHDPALRSDHTSRQSHHHTPLCQLHAKMGSHAQSVEPLHARSAWQRLPRRLPRHSRHPHVDSEPTTPARATARPTPKHATWAARRATSASQPESASTERMAWRPPPAPASPPPRADRDKNAPTTTAPALTRWPGTHASYARQATPAARPNVAALHTRPARA